MSAVATSTLAEDEALAEVRARPAMQGAALIDRVSARAPYIYCDAGSVRVAAVVDYGCKRSILRRLAGAGAHVTVVPSTTPADRLARHDAVYTRTALATRSRCARRSRSCASCSGASPCSGYCLGHQLLGLDRPRDVQAPLRHHGANHPVLERRSGQVLVASQNHGHRGRAVEADEATYVCNYDGTVEGFEFPSCARSVQFHPEAGPGPPPAPGRSWSAGSRRSRCRGVTTSARSA